MTREEIIQLIEDSSTKSIMVFLERTDTSVYPNNLPPATIVTNVVHFSSTPTMSDGSVADWRMTRSKSDILDGFTWYSIGTFRGDGTQVDNWTSPILVKIGKDGADGLNGKPGEDGYNGTDGADGSNIEYVFKLVEDIDAFNVLDPIPPEDNDPTQTGYVPDGWENHPQGISEDMLIEAMCYRTMNIETRRWNNFVGPYIWSQWGVAGKDGDGVEYIYRLATLGDGTSEGEAEYNNSTGIYTLKESYWPPTNQAAYDALPQADKEAWDAYDSANYPNNWTDDQQSVSNAKPVQFVSSRKYDGEHKKWGFFSEPKMWNKIPLADVNVTAFTSFAFTITPHDISGYTPVGGSANDPDPDDFYYDSYDPQGPHDLITWSDSIPSGGSGYVWMTTGVWENGILKVPGWSRPMKVNDSQGFQAEYSNDYPWDSNPRPKLPNFGEGTWAENEVAWRAKALDLGCGTWKDCKSDDPADYIDDPSFMATCQKKGGVWTDWVVTKIKGENGLSPIVLHIWNDSIGVTVDDENKTWSETSHTVTVEVQMGSENFEIDPTKVTFFNQNGGSLPQGITFNNIRVSENHYHCSFEIGIAQGIIFNDAFPIGINILGNSYDANSVIEIRPIPSSDGCTYDITFNEGDIYRTYTQNGTCAYSPEKLICKGIRTIGINAPETYGTLYYSTSTQRDAAKFKIGDRFDSTIEGIVSYPTEDLSTNQSGGIEIARLTNHSNLQIIYLYMVSEDDIVLDVEGFEIDTRGHYELSTSVKQIHIKGSTITPSYIKVFVWYSVPETNTKGLVTSHDLYYYLNGDVSTTRMINYRNDSIIPILSSIFQGFDINTTKSIDFILKDRNQNPLTDSVTISFVTDGTDGKSITATLNFFKAGKQTPAEEAPPSNKTVQEIKNNYGWSETPVNLTDSNPVLWQFIRIEYSDSSAKHLAAFPSRYYNQQANITYDQINTLIQEELNISLESAMSRLETVEDTDALIKTNKGLGLIELLTQYEVGDRTSFADIIADAASDEIKLQVGADVDEMLTTAGTKLNGLKGSVDTSAAKLSGIDSTVQGAISSVAADAITQAVTKSQYCWKALIDAIISIDGNSYTVKKDEFYPYGSSDNGITKRNTNESFETYENRILSIKLNGNDVFQKKINSEEMSTIKIESDKISLLVGTDGDLKAGIQIIANCNTNDSSYVTPSGQTIPAGSAIELDAAHIILNGDVLTGALNANNITITNANGGLILQHPTDQSLKTILSPTGITTNQGNIGGWSITKDGLEWGTINTQNYIGILTTQKTSYHGDDYFIIVGEDDTPSTPFYITRNGHLYSHSATFGCLNLDEDGLYRGSNNSYLRLGGESITYALWTGDETAANAPFSVKYDGTLKAVKGTIGGFDINLTNLTISKTINNTWKNIELSAATADLISRNTSNSSGGVYFGGGYVSVLNDSNAVVLQIGNHVIDVNGSDEEQWGHIHCPKGLFGGLRPWTRIVSSSTSSKPAQLDWLDFNVIFTNTDNYFKLPQSPLYGQTYHIFHMGTGVLYMNTNGKPFMRDGVSYSEKTNDDICHQSGMIIMVYDGSKWVISTHYGDS